MNAENNKKLEDKIRDYFKKWEWIVTKWGWRFDIFYYDTADDLSKKDRKEHPDACMFVDARFQYLKGGVYVILDRVDGLSDEEIEGLVVHELTHFLLDPIYNDLWEYSTETISRLFLMLERGAQ